MTRSKKVNGAATPVTLGVMLGVLVSVVSTAVLAAVLAWLTVSERIEERTVGYFIMGILVVASMLGGMVSAVKIKRRWVLVCCVTGVIYYLSLLGFTAIFFGDNYCGTGVTALMIMTGSVAVGALGLVKKERTHKNYKKYHKC